MHIKEWLFCNMDVVISFITMIVTWFLGHLSKKSSKIKNYYIPLQNIFIMILSVAIYWWVTGDFSAVIASSSPLATIIYDAIHSFRCRSE